MDETAEQVYSGLVQLPQTQWAAILAKLDSRLKRDLLQLIKHKRELNKETPTPSSKRRRVAITQDSVIDSITALNLPILECHPLDRLGALMYVAGDECSVSQKSEKIVHSYLNFWLSAFLWDLSCSKISQKNATILRESATLTDERKMIEKFWAMKKTHHTRAFQLYFEKNFQVELDKFTRDVSFQKLARKHISSPIFSDETNPSQNETLLPPNPVDHISTNSTTTCIKSDLIHIKAHLLPPERFSERLIIRDSRTKDFSTTEYKDFSKAREKSLRACRPLFQDWVNKTLSLVISEADNNLKNVDKYETGKRRCQVPGGTIDFMCFLVTDRVASLVELAQKLKEFLLDQGDEQLINSELLSNPRSFTDLWQQGKRLTLKKLVKGPFESELYELAVQLFLIYVDQSTFTFEQDLSHAFTQTLKYPEAVSKPEAESISEPVIKSDCGIEEKQEEFFDQLFATSQKFNSTFQVPQELEVFAYLFCKDLFWDLRHEALSSLWDAIETRFKKWKQNDLTKVKMFEEKYKKIVVYSEALNKIIALGNFFRAMKNKSSSSSSSQIET